MIESGQCKKCPTGQTKPIVNRTHWLCDEHNYMRLHNGKTRYEAQLHKAKTQQKVRKPIIFKKTPRKPIKIRKRPIDTIYSSVIKEIANEREKICTGCGKYQGGDIRLSNSHLISRKHCQEIGRIDLIADKNNITYHCMDFGNNEGCHRKWEGPRKIELLDYKVNMSYVKSINSELFTRLKISSQNFTRK